MKKTFKVGSFRGIGVFLHWSFLLLIGGLFLYYLIQGQAFITALKGIILVLAVFACVLLHEFGHALTAQRFQVPTLDITLYPIGGMARMQLIPEKPLHEFWISIAGPLVNVVLAILLFGLLKVQGSTFSVETLLTLEPEAAAPRDMIAALMVINIALAAFNVLPAFPMDGGRILRSLLAHFMDDYARATQIASVVGQGMAFFFGTLGLLIFNPILLFIAFFVFFAARQEAFQSMLRSVLRGVRAKDVMMRRFRTLNAGATLTEAINELLNSTDTLFPVQGDTGIAGLLTRDQVLEALSQHEPTITHLADIVNSGCHIVDESEPVADFMSDLNDPRQEGILITRRGRPVGLITQESLQNWYALSAALQKFNLKPRRVDAAPLPMPALVEMT